MSEENQEISLEEIVRRLDILGKQMNWLCENLESLFGFVSQMSASGGGLRGMLSLLRSSPPELQVMQGDNQGA
jgi:hypothetical protein